MGTLNFHGKLSKLIASSLQTFGTFGHLCILDVEVLMTLHPLTASVSSAGNNNRLVASRNILVGVALACDLEGASPFKNQSLP